MGTKREDRVLAKQLVRLRKAHGLSKKEMAKRLEIGVAHLSKWERGEIPPRLNVPFVWCVQDCFGVRPGELFTEEE